MAIALVEFQRLRSKRWCQCLIITCRQGNIGTNRDVLESPLRQTCSRRNGVRESVGRLLPVKLNTNASKSYQETHVEGGETLVQLRDQRGQLMADLRWRM